MAIDGADYLVIGLVEGAFDHLTFGNHVLQAFATQCVAARNKQGLIARAVAVLDEADLTHKDFFNSGIFIKVSS